MDSDSKRVVNLVKRSVYIPEKALTPRSPSHIRGLNMDTDSVTSQLGELRKGWEQKTIRDVKQ